MCVVGLPVKSDTDRHFVRAWLALTSTSPLTTPTSTTPHAHAPPALESLELTGGWTCSRNAEFSFWKPSTPSRRLPCQVSVVPPPRILDLGCDEVPEALPIMARLNPKSAYARQTGCLAGRFGQSQPFGCPWLPPACRHCRPRCPLPVLRGVVGRGRLGWWVDGQIAGDVGVQGVPLLLVVAEDGCVCQRMGVAGPCQVVEGVVSVAVNGCAASAYPHHA